jgi:outer membrane lipoprotein-sorting protein
MVQVPRFSRRARWAVPAAALVVTGGVMAGSLISVAQAAPALPPRTPAQLLATVAQDTVPPLSGTVTESVSLGLPKLPDSGNPTSISSLLTTSHAIQVWYAGPRHYRLALPASLSETDVIADGSTVWLWQSTQNAVTEVTVPAHPAATAPVTAPLTPQQAAQQVLATLGQTTAVSVGSNVTVADQPAYELILAPKDSRSLIGDVAIAVDANNGVPLRVEVFARGASSPAISVGYTSIRFGAPPSAEVSFTPPPTAKVTRVNLAGASGRKPPRGSAPGVGVTGSGWLTVLELPSSALTQATAGTGTSGGPISVNGGSGDSAAVLSALLASATPASGGWGSGRLLRTGLISVLMTSTGHTFVGAVQPSVLYAAAAQAAVTAP